MAPGLVEELPISPSEANNGKHSADPAAAKKGKYNAIPGPLGLASASLEGKVALVTGAGKSCSFITVLCIHVLLSAREPHFHVDSDSGWGSPVSQPRRSWHAMDRFRADCRITAVY